MKLERFYVVRAVYPTSLALAGSLKHWNYVRPDWFSLVNFQYVFLKHLKTF